MKHISKLCEGQGAGIEYLYKERARFQKIMKGRDVKTEWRCGWSRSGAGNLFEGTARWDFQGQAAGQIEKREHKKRQKTYRSVRQLVLLAMKCFNVRLGGWGRQQNNVTEVEVWELGAKSRLIVLHYGEEQLTTVVGARQGKYSNLTSDNWSCLNLNLEGIDVCVHVCQENAFAMQLHTEGVQMW